MKRGPQSQPRLIATFYPIQITREIGLDGCLFNVGHCSESHQRLLVSLANQRLSPGCEEHGDVVIYASLDPIDETVQGTLIFSVLSEVSECFAKGQ